MLAACNQPAKQKDHAVPPVVEQLNPMQLVPGGNLKWARTMIPASRTNTRGTW